MRTEITSVSSDVGHGMAKAAVEIPIWTHIVFLRGFTEKARKVWQACYFEGLELLSNNYSAYFRILQHVCGKKRCPNRSHRDDTIIQSPTMKRRVIDWLITVPCWKLPTIPNSSCMNQLRVELHLADFAWLVGTNPSTSW